VSTRRHPAAVASLAVALSGLAIAVSGCSTQSPTTITTPYAAADGTNAELSGAEIGTVKFRNVLLVSSAKDAPGVLLGAVVTDASSPVEITLAVLDDKNQPVGRFQLTAKPGQLNQLSQDQALLQVDKMPTAPGSTLRVEARTQAGGVDLSVPVVAPQNQYASLTPSAVPSTESPSPSESASPTESATPTPTATPTGKPSASKTSRTAKATASPSS
jgi:hypothetical protein